jgi:sec-independent protein translocase protein TatA
MLQPVYNTMLMISMPGGTEWILIILAVLILFGGRKIPEFMRGLGRGIREFNDAKTNVRREIEEGMNEPPKDTTTREKNSSTTIQP